MKIFSKKIITFVFIFIFLITSVSYNVSAIPQYTSDGSWVKIYKDPIDNTKLKTDYNTNTYSDLITLINYLISNGKYNIYIEDGDYDLNGTLDINSPGVTILGQSKENTKLVEKTTNKNSIKVNANNFKMVNCYIENTIGYVVFHAQNVDGANLINCNIKGLDGNPAVAFFGNNASKNSNSKIMGNTIISSGSGLPSSFGQAVIFINQNNGEISDNNVSGGSVDCEVCYDLKVYNNNVENSPKGGIKVLLPGENIKIIKNTTKNTYNSGIAVVAPSSDNNRYQGIEVKNNNITNTEYFGIEINNLDGGIIEDNIISKIDIYGMYILKSDNLNIENNQILNCELYNGGSPRWPTAIKASIYLETQVKNSNIKDNIIHNDITNPCEYGIRIQDDNNKNNTIFNNTIDGSFTTLISANIGGSDYTNVIEVDGVTKDSITIKWEEKNTATEYVVEVDGNSVDVGTNENYKHIGLLSSSTHNYRIRVKGSIGEWSGIITVKTLSAPSLPPVVSIPQNIKTSATESSIKISWDEIDATTEYEVEVDGSLVLEDVGTKKSYENTELISNSIHNYRIRVKGSGQWSGIITVKTLSAPSLPPVVLIPQNIKTASTESSIKIIWDEVNATSEYEVEVDGNLILQYVGMNESYENTGLLSNSIHNYRIRVKGSGQWSGIITIKTIASTSPPPVALIPQNIEASTTESSIRISWDEVDIATEYEVEIDGSLVVVDVGTNESYEHTGLLSISTHNYRVRIKGGQWSGFITAVTLASQTPITINPINISASTTESSVRIGLDGLDARTERESGNLHKRKNKNASNKYDKVEMNFGKRSILIYQNKLIENAKEDKVKRIVLYTFEEKYYVEIKAWKNNKIKINQEYELYPISRPVLTINEIKSIAIDTNDQIETILVPDMDGYISFMKTIENSGLSKYLIENGYIVYSDNSGTKVKKNQKITKIIG